MGQAACAEAPKTAFFRSVPAAGFPLAAPAPESSLHERIVQAQAVRIRAARAQATAGKAAQLASYSAHPAMPHQASLPPPPGWKSDWQATAAFRKRGSCMAPAPPPWHKAGQQAEPQAATLAMAELLKFQRHRCGFGIDICAASTCARMRVQVQAQCACSFMRSQLDWLRKHLGMACGRMLQCVNCPAGAKTSMRTTHAHLVSR